MGKRANLRTVQIGPVLFGYDRAEDGVWTENGVPTPWLYLRRPGPPTIGGWSLQIGPHVFGIHWLRRNAGQPT